MDLTIALRDRVVALEAAMHESPDQIQIVPRHLFAQGLYVREVTLPEGSTAVGYTHKQEHVCIVSKGRCLVMTETGVVEFRAPCTIIVPAGRKNAVHALEETVWTTVHATDCTDVAELEMMLTDAAQPLSLGEAA